MAILNWRFITYIKVMFENAIKNKNHTWENDALSARFLSKKGTAISGTFTGKQCAAIASTNNILKVLDIAFPEGILDKSIDKQTERQIISLKRGFPKMPATTASVIVNGFGANINEQTVLDVYASHGLSHNMKKVTQEYNFTEINRRATGLAQVLLYPQSSAACDFMQRWQAILSWKKSQYGKGEFIISELPKSKSLFFYWWDNFSRFGLLGLANQGNELFRSSKIKPANEARIVIDRLQHPKRADSFYVRRLLSMGVDVKRDTVAKVFKRWNIRNYNSMFISTLKRLELPVEEDKETCPKATLAPIRNVDENFLYQLIGMKNYSMPISAPGLLTLWTYIEELELFPLLDSMGLTNHKNRQQYSWFELLLFDIARRFYGIASPSSACEQESIDLAFFASLYKSPCNDTLLKGLRRISGMQVRIVRRWLVDRLAQLGLSTGNDIAFDFHHIDQDVLLPELRNFGKGPSPKKKLCDTGFRPHIAWDVGCGTLLVAEFRKASARGTTTIKRFVGEYILPVFQGLFHTVYLDSEYTGTDVWNLILDKNSGMGANLSACLKQNPLVKKARNKFLALNAHLANFWCYYDNNHVYTNDTFEIKWKYISDNGIQSNLKLTCMVKKHVATGKLRCFASSKNNISAKQILSDYSSRWVVENGIKDLVTGYFLNNCPGTDPHLVDIHFLIVTICKTLYRLIERDLNQKITNPDGTIKTLMRMRETLFKTGSASVKINQDTMLVSYANSFNIHITNILKQWFDILTARYSNGLMILGGINLKFKLQAPVGNERRNSGIKVPLATLKNSNEHD